MGSEFRDPVVLVPASIQPKVFRQSADQARALAARLLQSQNGASEGRSMLSADGVAPQNTNTAKLSG